MMSSVADVVTIIAFLITCFTAWKVFFINRDVQNMSNRYVLKKRLPEIFGDLTKICDALASPEFAHVTKDNVTELRALVAKCLGLCETLKLRVAGQKDFQLFALNNTILVCKTIIEERIASDEIRILPDSIFLSGSDTRKLHGVLSRLIQNIKDTMKDMESMI
jgi:hypothetical protein